MLTVLKILSWPVAAITEDFIVLFCVYSPLHAYEVGNCQVTPRLLCGVGRERQKRVCFPKAPWKSRDREGPPIQDHHPGALPAPRARRAQRGERRAAAQMQAPVGKLLLKEPAVGGVYHPAHNEAITLQSQL